MRKCIYCENLFDENKATNEKDICNECFDKHYGYCDKCNTLVHYGAPHTLSDYGCLCEKCYIKERSKQLNAKVVVGYMLIEAYEREIHTEVFDTLEKAQDEMENWFLNSVGFDSMIEVLDRYERDNDFTLNDFDGWSNIHDTNIDYKIVKIYGNAQEQDMLDVIKEHHINNSNLLDERLYQGQDLEELERKYGFNDVNDIYERLEKN